MIYEEFKEQMIEGVRNGLEEKGYQGVSVTLHQVDKINQSYEAMTISTMGSHTGVNLDLALLYQKVEQGEDSTKVLTGTVAFVDEQLQNMPEFDLNGITDYSKMKDKLVLEVISRKENENLLSHLPHKEMEDMAVVYRVMLENSEDHHASVLVTNKILDTIGISEEQLHEDALKNAPLVRPMQIVGMMEMMKELMDGSVPEEWSPMMMEDEEEMMYVATVMDKQFGAGVLAYPNFYEEAAEKVGGSYFILPSSRHEILLVPEREGIPLEQLEDMVQSVNATQVSPVDKLTDSVYHYDAKEHVFEIGEKYEKRRAEKEARSSLLGDLKSKREEIDKAPQKSTVIKALPKGEERAC